LVDNNAYRCRFDFTSDQNVAGKNPLVSINLDNIDSDDPFGAAN